MNPRRWTAIALVMLLLGCAGAGVEEGKRQWIDGTYSVDPQIQWSRFDQGGLETWTVDGLPLQALHFFKGVRKGQALLPGARRDPESKWPKFRPDMTPHEIMEVVQDSFGRAGLDQLQTHDLRPVKFGRVEGFRFGVTFLFRSGLEGEGLVVGAVVDGRLQLIAYLGAREHYYPKYLGTVEKLVQSIDVK